MSACLLFLIGQPSFFVSLYPASFSTCAGCTPGLQTRLCVFPALATCHAPRTGSLPHHPENLTTVCPSPLRFLSNPTGALKASRCTQVQTENTLNPLNQPLSRKGEALSVCKALGRSGRQSQGEQPLHNAISHFAALGHEIKRGIHCRSLKSFL